MSRSYRKPWIKDPANRYMKILHARKMRRITRQITHVWTKEHPNDWWLWCTCDEWEDCTICRGMHEPIYPHRYEIDDPWDICDFRYYVSAYMYHWWGRIWSDEDVKRYSRK